VGSVISHAKLGRDAIDAHFDAAAFVPGVPVIGH
jgi:hypothetical protein